MPHPSPRAGLRPLLVLTVLAELLLLGPLILLALGSDSALPARILLILTLLLALLLVPGLLLSWLRWLRQRPRPLRPLLCSLGLVLAALILPDMTLWSQVTYAPAGFLPEGETVRKRSLENLLQEGWHRESMRLETMQPAHDPRPWVSMEDAPSTLCVAQTREARGFLEITRFHNWADPVALLHGQSMEEGLARCQESRLERVRSRHTLEALLLADGTDDETLRQALDRNMAEEGVLPLLRDDLPPALRTRLQALQFDAAGHQNPAVSLFDLALLLKDREQILKHLPRKGPVPYQRHALFHAGLAELLNSFSPATDLQAGLSLWAQMRASPLDDRYLSQPGGEVPFDLALANSACDVDYARFLIQERGIRPDLFMATDLVHQLIPLSRQPYEREWVTPRSFSRGERGDCTALARLYAAHPDWDQGEDAAVSARRLAARLGTQVLSGYQALADQALEALPRQQRLARHSPEVDAIYDRLSFTAAEYPVPDSLQAFAALYSGRYNSGALCGTLQYAPWTLSHPEIIAIYRDLWRSWRDVLPDTATDTLSTCRLNLLHPSSLYASQTALRNDWLQQAGLPCRVRLLNGDTMNARTLLECRP